MSFLSAYLLLFILLILGASIGSVYRKGKSKISELKHQRPGLYKTYPKEVYQRYIEIHRKKRK